MPISIASVSSAAPFAARPNRRSTVAPVRGFLTGGGLVVVRAPSAGRSRGFAAAGKLDDTGRSEVGACSSGVLMTRRLAYLTLTATGLPDASLISPQAVAMTPFTLSGIGT